MILKINNTIKFSAGDLQTLDKIPTGNWLVKVDNATGEFYLEQQADFELPSKVYGGVYDEVARYLQTYSKRDKNLGILLKGMKGTGKSLTAKCLCIASRLPVILITSPFSGPVFESFLSNITQDCIIFLDEFEKTFITDDYDDNQASLLSIFDGVFQSKKLFLLTANNHRVINNALINRPGRIHYLKEYGGLDTQVINEIIEDLLDNKDHANELKQVLEVVGEVSMDILISLIKEMNMYKETAKKAVSFLNIRPGDTSYKIMWEEEEENEVTLAKETQQYTSQVNYHPLSVNEINLYGLNPEASKASKLRKITLSEMDIKVNKGEIMLYGKNNIFRCVRSEEFRFTF